MSKIETVQGWNFRGYISLDDVPRGAVPVDAVTVWWKDDYGENVYHVVEAEGMYLLDAKNNDRQSGQFIAYVNMDAFVNWSRGFKGAWPYRLESAHHASVRE